MCDKKSEVTKLTSSLREIDINNVFIYVGDAVRYDYLPQEFFQEGAVIKTIAASTHSPTSFASLVSGQPAFVHGVSSFKDKIHDDVFRLFDLEDHYTEFVNSILHEEQQDPIFSVLGIDPDSKSNFPNGVPEPYVIMERGQGGHAPYDPHYSTAADYFNNVNWYQLNDLRQDYRDALEKDKQKFFQRCDQLGIDDDTLVIYTSDHGELLGEGGMFGHTSPMRPELVKVPTVFIHPDLPTGLFDDMSFRHTDLLPTIMGSLGYNEEEYNLQFEKAFPQNGHDRPSITRYKLEFLSFKLPLVSGQLYFEGVWDSEGGYVFPRSSLPDRSAFLLGKLLTSDKRSLLGSRIISALRSYTKGEIVYNSPSFTRETALERLESVPLEHSHNEQENLSESDLEHLRDLGYL